MKVCVVMAGVARPSSQRIIENIKNNISFFTTKYPQHTFEFVVFAYKNNSYNEILLFCETNNITSHFMEPIVDVPTEIDKYLYKSSYDIVSKNRYRLFYSMNHILHKITNDYDAILRLRIDTEIQSFELADTILPYTYYTVIDTETSCSDNIGYGSCEVMKKVWDLKNCFVKAMSNEHLVFMAIRKNSYRIKQFKFDYIMYQDNSESFDGVKQWSKRNRRWIYDGKTYVKGEQIV